MKIALLHYSAPPIVGGVESVIAHHARLMAAAGHDVRIIAGTGGVFDRRISYTSIPSLSSTHTAVLDFKAQLDKGVIPPGFDAFVAEIKNRLIPATTGLDCIIAHNVCSLHKNLALTAALHDLSQDQGFPKLILWHHDLAWTSARYRDEMHPGYPWDLLRAAWPGVEQVTISELRHKELAQLQNVSTVEIRVVPVGLDVIGMLKLGSVARHLIERLNLLSAAPLLLLPVRLTRRKNIQLALQTLAELLKNHPDAKLVVTGPLGPHNPANRDYFAELKKARQDLGLSASAFFLAELIEGSLPDEVIFDLYRMADAMILPSLEEGFGIPILEAGLVGIPIFCTDIPTLKALGQTEALYFSPDSKPAQVAAMISGVLQSNLQYRLRVRVRQEYSWQSIYAKHIAPLIESHNDT
jgi:glycosyltransferase involved in cell wall biosynthesis